MKIKPEQVPEKVVKAARRAWKSSTSIKPDADMIAAAINAWPERGARYERHGTYLVVTLPIEETSDAE